MPDFREQSTDPAVKAASVAAVAADQSLVVALSPNSPATVADLVASGTLAAAAQTVALSVAGGMSAASAQITGTWVGTIQFEGTVDGTNWIPINGVFAGTSAPGPTITVNGVVRITPSGLASIRLNATAWTSGAATITMRAGRGTGGTFLNQSLPIGANLIGSANVNTANASAVVVMQNAVAATGNGTSLTVTGYGTSVLQVTGAFVASIAFEASVDAGTTWFAISATQVGQGDLFNVATVPGLYRITSAGMDLLRARVTWTSGTSITINGRSTNAVNASKIIKLATSGLSIGTVQMAALTKSTQGTTGVTTQDLKDAGRVNVAMTCYQAAGIITTEALFAVATFSFSRDGAAATTGQQLVVTTAKRFRMQSIVVGVKNTAAAAGTSKLALRYNAAGGAITNASTILTILDMGTNGATANAYIGPTEMALPDGVELIAGSTFGFTSLCSAVTMLHTITVNGYEY